MRFGEANLAGAIYGTILATAVVATLSEDSSIGPWDLLAGVVSTTVVFWLAHAYANLIAARVLGPGNLSWPDARAALVHEWPMMQAALPSIVFLLLAAAGAYDRTTGVTLAIAAGIGALFGWGAAIARRNRLGWPAMLAGGVANASFGLVLVALKAIIH
jgi:hypothetical protein